MKEARKEGLFSTLPELPVVLAGVFLFLLEIWKQVYLYLIYFDHSYNVWYLPFQLCSLPMYLSVLYACLLLSERGCFRCLFPGKPARRTMQKRKMALFQNFQKQAILNFLQAFGLLGGIAALLVPDGFTYPAYPLLTLHGYVWHITMVGMAAYIAFHRLSEDGIGGFQKALCIFLPAALFAELLDIALHPFGDCDMFYISPYHLSSQPVFHEIDGYIGRPLGILLYLLMVSFAAFLLHTGISRLHRFAPP